MKNELALSQLKIENALKKIQAKLKTDMANVIVESVSNYGIVKIKFTGELNPSERKRLALRLEIEKNLKELIPEVSLVLEA